MSINMLNDDMVQVGSRREEQAKEAARVIYGSTGQSRNNSAAVGNSHYTGSLSSSWAPEQTKMSAVRRTFCLLATFDLGLIFIIWVIYTQLLPSESETNKWEQFIDQVEKYDIQKSLFDIVMLACVRFTLLLLAYALFRLNHWWMIAISTTITCSFLLAKCFVFNFMSIHDNALGYVLLIVSFSMSWIETWFLDFKVLPSERKARHRGYCSRKTFIILAVFIAIVIIVFANYNTYNERSSLIRDPESPATEDNEYYSPENSDESDTEAKGDKNEGSRGHSQQEQEYVQLGDELLNTVWEIHQTTDGWKLEKGDNNDDGIIHSIYNKKIKRKVYRLQAEVDFRALYLWEECAYHLEENASWNPTTVENRVLQAINDNTDIAYTIAAEAAGGIVAARDFVNIRRWAERDGQYLSLVSHTTFSGMPPQKKYVRGENGPGGFVFIPLPNNPKRCKFMWYLNTNLKGWLPQSAIDVGLTGVMFDYLKSLRAHIDDLKNQGIS